jgi:cytochrome c oxidase subunit III
MSQASVIDVSGYTPFNNGRAAPLWWGFWGMILVETIVFSSLIASYFYLRLVASSWPPAGIEPPKLLLPTINTVLLVASSFFVHMADKGIKKGDLFRLRLGLGVGILLAAAFLVIKVIEYSKVTYTWDQHAYGSIVWTITGFHALHVTALVLKTLVIEVLALRGYFDEERNIGVEVNGMYWHFVVAVWIPLYLVLYWGPRVMG